jgi:hypothetical protein
LKTICFILHNSPKESKSVLFSQQSQKHWEVTKNKEMGYLEGHLFFLSEYFLSLKVFIIFKEYQHFSWDMRYTQEILWFLYLTLKLVFLNLNNIRWSFYFHKIPLFLRVNKNDFKSSNLWYI